MRPPDPSAFRSPRPSGGPFYSLQAERLWLYSRSCLGLYWSIDGTHFEQDLLFEDPSAPGVLPGDNCVRAIATSPGTHPFVYLVTSASSAGYLPRIFRSSSPWRPTGPPTDFTWEWVFQGITDSPVPTGQVAAAFAVGSSFGARFTLTTGVPGGEPVPVFSSYDGSDYSLVGHLPARSYTVNTLLDREAGLFAGNRYSFYSPDHGATWLRFRVEDQHDDVRGLFLEPNSGSTGLGRIWYTTDGGGPDGEMQNVAHCDLRSGPRAPYRCGGTTRRGLPAWQLHTVAAVATRDGRLRQLYAGTQDNGDACMELDPRRMSSEWFEGVVPRSGDTFALVSAPSDPDILYAQTQLEGTWRGVHARGHCGSIDWHHGHAPYPALTVFGPNRVAVDPLDARHLVATSFTQMAVSRDGADTFVPRLLLPSDPLAFVPSAVHIDSGGTAYSGTSSSLLFTSGDGGDTWVPSALLSGSIDAIRVSRPASGPATYWVGTTDGLWRGIAGGGSGGSVAWEHVLQPVEPGWAYVVSDVEIDPTCASRVYVAMGSTSGALRHPGGILMTPDGGMHWQSLTRGDQIDRVPIRDIQLDPLDPRILYAATYGRGLWAFNWGEPPPSCEGQP